MQAIILAGGKGTRLKPYTTVFPKPLVPVGDRPVLEIIVRQLRAHGITDLTLAVNHLAELIQAFFGTGERWGVDIRYSREQHPLGTAAPVALVEDLDDDFIVMNGDVLTDIDYGDLARHHQERGSIATVATYCKEVPISLGVLDVGPESRLEGYTEKPVLNYKVSMGIYVLNKRVIEFIPKGQYFDFPDLMKALIKSDEEVHCYEFDGAWLDIGRPEDYALAVEMYENNHHMYLPGTYTSA